MKFKNATSFKNRIKKIAQEKQVPAPTWLKLNTENYNNPKTQKNIFLNMIYTSYFFLNKIKYVFHKETHSINKYKNDNPSLYFTTYKTPKLNPTKTKRKYKLLKIFFLFTLITTL